jgi:hypothetical protein
MMNWPDPPTKDFRTTPRRGNNLLAHWEWVLWTHYRKAHEEGEIYKGREGEPSTEHTFWKTHTRTFWERLESCPELTRLCQRQPSLDVHRVLTWLFWYYDMVERKTLDGTGPTPPTDGVFGFQQRTREDRQQQIKRAQKSAAKLETARTLVARTPLDYLSADERKTVDQLLTKGRQTAQRHADPGPTALVFNLSGDGDEETIVVAPEAPAVSTKRRGKPAGTGGDLNMYLTLLVDLLNEILQGRGHLKVALAILHAFTPPQFQKKNTPWMEDTLRLTVHQFKHQGGDKVKQAAIAEKLRGLRAWLLTPAVRKLCPVPTFLLHLPSASVADAPR